MATLIKLSESHHVLLNNLHSACATAKRSITFWGVYFCAEWKLIHSKQQKLVFPPSLISASGVHLIGYSKKGNALK